MSLASLSQTNKHERERHLLGLREGEQVGVGGCACAVLEKAWP